MTGQPVENLEDTLNRTLERYAGKAPAPAPDLVERVETRYRKRRRARMTGAAAAMALVLGGTTFGVWPDDGGTVVPSGSLNPAASTPGQEKESPFEITPIEKLWPEAVHRIPTELPNGTEIEPQALIDERTVLVNAWSKFEKTSVLYAYDLATGEARKITDVVTPKKTKIFASGFTVGDGKIIWYTASTDGTSTIWSVPVEGGAAVATVERIPGETGDGATASASAKDGATASAKDGTTVDPVSPGIVDLAVSGGKIYWSGSLGGVHTAPLTGGPAELVPGTEKELLVQWPWAGGPVRDRSQDGGKAHITHRELRNLETGEKRSTTLEDGDTNWDCGITWCLSQDGRSVTSRDGNRMALLPGRLVNGRVALDRFALSTTGSGDKARILVHDLRTGRVGSIAPMLSDGDATYSLLKGTGSRMYATPVEDGHLIVDLEAVD
ncbi:hypothetical protein [Actinocorallia aurantiaca]|uniref:WD40 repeat protein n=1 Tax=Actinocorallia aurantiaca TaxID=46204 RepID=A0ABN3U320_9ACTN